MSLNVISGRPGAVSGQPLPSTSNFDFVVAQRPIYHQGDGPPLAPISVMPLHDKDGQILFVLELDGSPRYVVGFEDKPNLRVSVKAQNILDWVSPRTFEDWEYSLTKAREKAELERLPKTKEQKKRLKEQKRSRAKSVNKHMQQTGSSKKMKHAERSTGGVAASTSYSTCSSSATGPGRRRQSVAEPLFTSPQLSQRSQRPSLSTPVKNHRLAEIINLDSELEEDDVDLALQMQFDADLAGQSTGSITSSSEPGIQRGSKGRSTPKFKSGSSHSKSPGPSPGSSPGYGHMSHLAGKNSIAGTSSREARAIYEDLEKNGTAFSKDLNQYRYRKPDTHSQKASIFKYRKNVSPRADDDSSLRHQWSPFEDRNEVGNGKEIKQSRPFPRKPAETVQIFDDEEDDDEYDVDEILNHETRPLPGGKEDTWYLIKWVGNWEDTWEPGYNVGGDAIAAYKAKMKARKAGRMKDIDKSAKESPRGDKQISREMKGESGSFGEQSQEMHHRRVLGNEDQSDDDSLFVSETARRFNIGRVT